jgi:hypothetical protein
LGENVTTAWREVRHRLKLYDDAFASLTKQGNPEKFRAFLVHSSSHFINLGDRVGRLEQVVGFWDDRFGEHMVGTSADDVLDAMRDLLQALSLDISALPPAPELLSLTSVG